MYGCIHGILFSCLCVWHEDKSLLWLVNKQKLYAETKVNNISKRQNTIFKPHIKYINIKRLCHECVDSRINKRQIYWKIVFCLIFSVGKDQSRSPDSPESVQVMDPKSPISPQQHNSLAPPRSNRNGSSSPIVNGNNFSLNCLSTATMIWRKKFRFDNTPTHLSRNDTTIGESIDSTGYK